MRCQSATWSDKTSLMNERYALKYSSISYDTKPDEEMTPGTNLRVNAFLYEGRVRGIGGTLSKTL